MKPDRYQQLLENSGKKLLDNKNKMTREKLKIGLFGYGCVGQGLHDVLNSSKGFKADIVKNMCQGSHKKKKDPDVKFHL